MILEYKKHAFNLAQPIDISIAMHSGYGQVNAFYAPPFRMTPVKEGNFVGSTKMGGAVNFMNIQLNPHGNGTHTECIGHISSDDFYVNECFKDYYTIAELLSVYPELKDNGDKVIERHHIESLLMYIEALESLIIRTLPNDDEKCHRSYSGTNPTYISSDAMEYIVSIGVKHLLVDIPSVDREQDEGQLASHKIFWNYEKTPRIDSSITELIYVSNDIKDGLYLLCNIIPNIKLDAVPSRPILYPLVSKK